MLKKIVSAFVACAAFAVMAPAVPVGGDSVTHNEYAHFHTYGVAEAYSNTMYRCKRCKMTISVRPGDRPQQSALFPCTKEDPYHQWERIN
jgi:hypothetical protein